MIFIMVTSKYFTSFSSLKREKNIIAENTPSILQAIISRGQCTPTIIRERFMIITRGRKIYPTL